MSEDLLKSIREAFDERAANYDESAMHQALAASVADFLDLTGVQTVLDVGTGTGLLLRFLDRRSPGLDLIGADLSPGMLAVASEKLTNATWIEADATSLPLPDASIDLITCVTALHMIPDMAATIREWRRLLRQEGCLVTATFLRDRGRPGPGSPPPYPVDHERFDSVESLAATVAPFGFGLSRHEEWRHREDAVLIAELTPRAPLEAQAARQRPS